MTFLKHLKEVWTTVRDKIIPTNVAEHGQETECSLSIVRMHDLAESIFRLSLNQSDDTMTCTSEVVKRNIFGPSHSEFELFMLNYWENSPFLFRRVPLHLNDHEDSFNAFVQSFKSKRTLNVILSSILGGLVSCPPLPSDDIDILSFLKEVKDGLGCPIIYEQDVRVLKTVDVGQENMKREVHFLEERTGFSEMNDPNATSVDVRKCEEAMLDGYTVALRGMEFRSENIAAIADGLAALFGQPSVGANAYLTPPGSQGLARHYDDHCVFVCQLLGQKRWTVLPRPTLLLPRLYEPLHNLHSLEVKTIAPECQQILLGEGEILYIPRGCPHEAYTATDDGGLEMDDATGFSLHLTLGIEVEPPFEWEGFAHVALNCWNGSQKQLAYTPIDPLPEILNVLSINLLHVSVQLIGCRDPVFRKACMVTSFSLPSDNEENHQSDALDLNQRNTFRYVVNCIDREANFMEAFKSVEAAVQEQNEDLFHRLRWLRHLYHEGETERGPDWNTPLTGFGNLLQLCDGGREDAESAFRQAKSKFCREIIIENVLESFKMLLQKYKSTRKQYMNGMLSLHCT